MKRLLAAVLFIVSGWLDRASKWCAVKSMSLLGFSFTTIPIPSPPPDLAGGCMGCGSMFAVKAEFDAHKCPKAPA
jgi:hypothetical protein